MGQTLLSVEHLDIEFKADKKRMLTAVQDVSFSVEKGETLGIVGESGCGKSITCMSLLQLNPPHTTKYPKGKILFEGKNLLGMKPKELAKIRGNEISMIFQEPMTALNPLFRVGNQMIEALQNHDRKLTRAEASGRSMEYLRKVHFAKPKQIMEQYPFQMSGGMRQRVMIAMALMTQPKLLIADEPTTALDVTVQAQVLRVMNELKADGGTACIFISHDLAVVRRMADRVAVMYGGRIVEEGSAEEVFRHPKHPYTIGLIESRPTLEYQGKRLKTIEGNVPSLEEMPKGCPFHSRCRYAMEQCRAAFPQKQGDGGHWFCCFHDGEVER